MTRVSKAGSVLLDIGAGIGAAVVYGPDHLDGQEIEIRAAGAVWDGAHTAFRHRQMIGKSVCAAVFQTLPEGGYEVRLYRGPARPLVVVEGRVTELHLSGPP